jgi:hypothetical protein
VTPNPLFKLQIITTALGGIGEILKRRRNGKAVPLKRESIWVPILILIGLLGVLALGLYMIYGARS